jgi:hypothetical protein
MTDDINQGTGPSSRHSENDRVSDAKAVSLCQILCRPHGPKSFSLFYQKLTPWGKIVKKLKITQLIEESEAFYRT